MTPGAFRKIALGLEGVVEGAHHRHADFRVRGRIFATLGYPDAKWGMVSLTPDQQRAWMREHPGVFIPAKGKWGEQGATIVKLAAADEEMIGETLTLARRNVVAKATAPAKRRAGPRAAT